MKRSLRRLFLLPFVCALPVQPVSFSAEIAPADPPALPEDGATIVDCYDTATANLERICEDYRRIKALELAQIRDIAFLDAYENIQSVMPELKPINRDLLRKRITDPAEITAHKREVELAESEVRNMVELAARLLAEIEVQQRMQEAGSPPKPLTLEEIVQSPEYDPTKEPPAQAGESRAGGSEALKQLSEKARENPQHRAVDVTAEMRAAAGSGSPDRQELKGSSLTAQQMESQVFQPRPTNYEVGRKVVSEGGPPVEWMFIDTWYTIGPFPNPQRVNLNTKFPPETVVNLSATYPGKGGKMVKWKFLQTNRDRCVPHDDEEYAIYYAYTEIWFDEAMDLWVAIGSDDKANVWINNLPVWISGDELKPWRVNEGLRKVHFQKGLNKVLYRVENGWRSTAFSLGIQIAR